MFYRLSLCPLRVPSSLKNLHSFRENGDAFRRNEIKNEKHEWSVEGKRKRERKKAQEQELSDTSWQTTAMNFTAVVKIGPGRGRKMGTEGSKGQQGQRGNGKGSPGTKMPHSRGTGATPRSTRIPCRISRRRYNPRRRWMPVNR